MGDAESGVGALREFNNDPDTRDTAACRESSGTQAHEIDRDCAPLGDFLTTRPRAAAGDAGADEVSEWGVRLRFWHPRARAAKRRHETDQVFFTATLGVGWM
jgi:hypothetical protein